MAVLPDPAISDFYNLTFLKGNKVGRCRLGSAISLSYHIGNIF